MSNLFEIKKMKKWLKNRFNNNNKASFSRTFQLCLNHIFNHLQFSFPIVRISNNKIGAFMKAKK